MKEASWTEKKVCVGGEGFVYGRIEVMSFAKRRLFLSNTFNLESFILKKKKKRETYTEKAETLIEVPLLTHTALSLRL